MALRRKTLGGSNGKQLYMLEFFVDRLNLHCNKSRANSSNQDDVYVRVHFLHLTPFDVNVHESTIADQRNKENRVPTVEECNLACGASRIFDETPHNLIHAIGTTPLSIEVRRKQATSVCFVEQILCLAKVPLPKCLCEHVASFDKANFQAVHLVKSMYRLTDLKCRLAGYISISLKLWCLGESISPRYCENTEDGALSSRNHSDGAKIKFPRNGNGEKILKSRENDNGDETMNLRNMNEFENLKPRSMAEDLPEETRLALKRPNTPPRISIEDPAFEKLTSAEKLNDPQYRGIVYSCYPDEPTCSCRPPSRSKYPSVCQGGCTRNCCLRLRNPKSLFQKKENIFTPSHCIGGGTKDASSAGNPDANRFDSAVRMRGGADHVTLPQQESKLLMKNTRFLEDTRSRHETLRFKLPWTPDIQIHDVLRIKGGAENYFDHVQQTSNHSVTSNNDIRILKFKKHASNNTELKDIQSNTHSTSSTHNHVIKPSSLANNVLRLNGGGTEDYPVTSDSPTNPETDEFNWYGELIKSESRLYGGGETNQSNCTCPGATTVTNHYKDPTAQFPDERNACRPSPRDPSKASCVCPGRDKESSSPKKGLAVCTKKPCSGVDCLLRSFQDLQDFVDSLGKVPGLVGLGLMDPSESPYFGRDLDKDYAPQEPPLAERKRAAHLHAHNPQCTAPCNLNAQTNRPGTGISTGSAIPGAPFTIAVPGRTGVVREAIPALPDSNAISVSQRTRRKEDKKKEKEEEKAKEQKELDATASMLMDVDVGPCGEPKCKSRKKGTDVGAVSSEHTDTSQRKSGAPPFVQPQVKKIAGGLPKSASKSSERNRHLKGKFASPGPGGDQAATGRTPMKVSKRIMRYVYSIGDAYPGVNVGHKNCVEPRLRVPANMGWLWNTNVTIGKLKPRLGWKPGAIARFLNEMLKEAKEGSLQDESRPRSAPARNRRAKMIKTMSYTSLKKSQAKKEAEEEIESPPTLHIHRKDGTYYVTMYPIKQEIPDGVPRIDEPMKPLQFKIVKNRDDASVASSSTASDMEIEFSPPAAVNRNRRKPDVVHVGTQVRQQEILDALKTTDADKKKEKRAKKEKDVKKEKKVKK